MPPFFLVMTPLIPIHLLNAVYPGSTPPIHRIHPSADPAWRKVTFDVSRLSAEGLVGAGEGKRSLTYEFCIPTAAASLERVRAIDPTLQCYAGSPGRIGCRRTQSLCLGDTHKAEWQAILLGIARLTEVERIDEHFGE